MRAVISELDLNNPLDWIDTYAQQKRQVPVDQFRPNYERIMYFVKKLYPLDGSRILDLGCGTGWFTALAVQDGYDVTGLDLHHRLLRVAQERLLGNERPGNPFVVSRVEAVPLLSEHFDACFSLSVIEHIPDWEKHVEEAYRILKPGGVLVIETANALSGKSGDIDVPFFPWFPLSLRKRISVAKFGKQVLTDGMMSWSQLTYFGLSRVLRTTGFAAAHSILDLVEPDDIRRPSFRRLT